MSAALHGAIERSLASHNYRNAVFLAERLYAAERSDETAFVLATAYYREGAIKRAYRLLHERPSTAHCAANRFLLARCCVELEEMVEAESLLKSPAAGGSQSAESLELLGVVYRRTRRKELAISTFKAAMALDATLWTAYENLCELAADVQAADVFPEFPAGEDRMEHDVTTTPNPSMSLNFSGFGTTPVAAEAPPAEGRTGAPWLMGLLRELGAGYKALCLYDCATTIERLDSLPPAQRNTGWVLAQLGRAYFEQAEYGKAHTVFEEMRSVDPGRIEGLEIFSTVLWHLRKEVDLCYLAQQAMELERTAWQCSCVVGNCFALQKEHEAALKFFQRAMQVAPGEPYAHTLAGHEHLANEDFDRALDSYRAAIRADERHYNAWYGLGYVYYRQEKYDLAEYHFKRAIGINERSTVLWCYMGIVLAAKAPSDEYPQDRYSEALEHLEKALRTPNAVAQYKKACVLEKMQRYEETLEVLMSLKTAAPKEPSVQLLLGKVYRKLGQECEAMHHYNMAVFLDPNKADQVKAQQEKMARGPGVESDDDEEDEIF